MQATYSLISDIYERGGVNARSFGGFLIHGVAVAAVMRLYLPNIFNKAISDASVVSDTADFALLNLGRALSEYFDTAFLRIAANVIAVFSGPCRVVEKTKEVELQAELFKKAVMNGNELGKREAFNVDRNNTLFSPCMQAWIHYDAKRILIYALNIAKRCTVLFWSVMSQAAVIQDLVATYTFGGTDTNKKQILCNIRKLSWILLDPNWIKMFDDNIPLVKQALKTMGSSMTIDELRKKLERLSSCLKTCCNFCKTISPLFGGWEGVESVANLFELDEWVTPKKTEEPVEGRPSEIKIERVQKRLGNL